MSIPEPHSITPSALTWVTQSRMAVLLRATHRSSRLPSDSISYLAPKLSGVLSTSWTRYGREKSKRRAGGLSNGPGEVTKKQQTERAAGLKQNRFKHRGAEVRPQAAAQPLSTLDSETEEKQDPRSTSFNYPKIRVKSHTDSAGKVRWPSASPG